MLQIAWHFNIIVITINFKPKFFVNLWLVQCNYYYFVASLVVQTVKHLQCRGPGFSPWVRKIPWRRKWQPTPVLLLPGKSHGQRSLVGWSPWGCKEWDRTERLALLPSFILQISLSWLGQSLLTPGPSCYLCYLCVITYYWTKRKHTVRQRPVVCCATLLQSCLTLCDPMKCKLPGSSVHWILQARILEWVSMLFSRESSGPRDRTHISWVSGLGRWVFYQPHSCATCHISLTHISLMILPKFMIFGSYNLSMYLEGEWVRIHDQSLWLAWHVNSNFPSFFRERHVLVWKKLLHLCSFVGLTWCIMSPDTSVLYWKLKIGIGCWIKINAFCLFSL